MAMESKDVRVVWHQHAVSRDEREKLSGHRGCVLWFTGLSGSGKSTLANLVDHKLHAAGVHTFVLDGDNIRHGLNASAALLEQEHGKAFAERFGLGFSAEDREENIRRIGAVSELFVTAGMITLTAFISPYRRDRDTVRRKIEASGQVGDFIEIFLDAPLEVCEARDPKGMYKKAREGKLKCFTGIDDPYDPPEKPELHLTSAEKTPEVLADEIIAYLRNKKRIP